MREPLSRDSAAPRELTEATRRLDRALEQLEAACAAKSLVPPETLDDRALAQLETDRARLAAELEAARTRGSELEAAAAAASAALGRAAAEVRAALEEDQAGDVQSCDGRDQDGRAGGTASPDSHGLNEEAA